MQPQAPEILAGAAATQPSLHWPEAQKGRRQPRASVGVWGFGVLGFWGFGFLGFWVFGFWGFWGFGVLGFWGFGVLGFWGFGVWGLSFRV